MSNLFIGTKQIKAVPMTRLVYNQYRGWPLPEDENGEDDGYLVEYMDGGKPNHEKHEGYISWSPAEQFKNAYQNTAVSMSFGHAIEMMKAGHKVARQGWNGKGMHIYLNKNEGRAFTNEEIEPCFCMFTAQGKHQPGWLASQADMLAVDWVVV